MAAAKKTKSIALAIEALEAWCKQMQALQRSLDQIAPEGLYHWDGSHPEFTILFHGDGGTIIGMAAPPSRGSPEIGYKISKEAVADWMMYAHPIEECDHG